MNIKELESSINSRKAELEELETVLEKRKSEISGKGRIVAQELEELIQKGYKNIGLVLLPSSPIPFELEQLGTVAKYVRYKERLTGENFTVSLIRADLPEKLCGFQFDVCLVTTRLSSEMLDMLGMCMRVGENPKIIII